MPWVLRGSVVVFFVVLADAAGVEAAPVALGRPAGRSAKSPSSVPLFQPASPASSTSASSP
jgi:hypothetical protein